MSPEELKKNDCLGGFIMSAITGLYVGIGSGSFALGVATLIFGTVLLDLLHQIYRKLP